MIKLLDILPGRGRSAIIEFRNALQHFQIKIPGFSNGITV